MRVTEMLKCVASVLMLGSAGTALLALRAISDSGFAGLDQAAATMS
jgi:hypothetical protein